MADRLMWVVPFLTWASRNESFTDPQLQRYVVDRFSQDSAFDASRERGRFRNAKRIRSRTGES